MQKLDTEIINRWYETIEAGPDEFLDFMAGMNVNECRIEDQERCIYFEDGIHYIAHGSRMGENDSKEAKEIIDFYQDLGGEFKEDQ